MFCEDVEIFRRSVGWAHPTNRDGVRQAGAVAEQVPAGHAAAAVALRELWNEVRNRGVEVQLPPVSQLQDGGRGQPKPSAPDASGFDYGYRKPWGAADRNGPTRARCIR